jgi:hypothetical protein
MSGRRDNGPREERRNPLAESLDMSHTWCPNEDAMLAALRVVLGLPTRPASLHKEVVG